MKVQIEIVVQTADFGKSEFKREIEKLIHEIDPQAKLLYFDMYEKLEEPDDQKS